MRTSKKLVAMLMAALQALTPVISAAQEGPTTTIHYDAAGQVTQVTSGGGRTTQSQWDSLGRLASQSRAGSTIAYGYNGQDAVTGVTDPRNLSTSYGRNGFGEALTLTSPDTGASSYTTDLNGNPTSRTNAAGQKESYVYDAANRVTSKSIYDSASGTRTYTYTYGQNGTSEAGQLTGITSGTNFTLSFSHNLLGQTTSATQVVSGSSRTTQYAYDTNGALHSITYPSGRVVTYSRDSSSRVTTVSSGGTALLTSISYNALGALAGWSFGNNLAVTRTYDIDSRITGVSMPGGERHYTFDADDRIVGIDDPVLGTATYEYDDLDRLTSANTSKGSWTYQYDATGNRLSASGTTSNTVSIDNNSNQVLATSGQPSRLYTYTAAGQPRLIDGSAPAPGCSSSLSFGYQADGLLIGSTYMSAVYSPDGLRLQKRASPCAGGAAVTTNFVYDLAGHLIGEYDATGVAIQETVWLGDIPVAVFKPSVAATPFYVFADNLGTPRAIINSSAQVVWQWDGEPFGATPADSNPSGLGDFVYNLRFPGQYLDVETGYHHNGWREYDPTTGRYLQSDPIGLNGGINTYAYASDNPLTRQDPAGLVDINMFNPVTQRQFYLIARDLNISAWFTVAAHMGTDHVEDNRPFRNNIVYAESLAKIIQKDGRWHGQPIFLMGCQAGKFDPQGTLAQKLANLLHTHVYAYVDFAWYTSDGLLPYSQDGWQDANKQWHTVGPRTKLKGFSPQ